MQTAKSSPKLPTKLANNQEPTLHSTIDQVPATSSPAQLMKILIRSLLVILALIALLGLLGQTPFGQNIFGGDAARQACIDHMAEQAVKGQPIPYDERLAQWAAIESRNLFAEPEIFNYFTQYETASETEREAILELASDRLLRGMDNCNTVSMVPIGVDSMKTESIYFPNGTTIIKLWRHALEKVDHLIADGREDDAITALAHLHQVLAARNNHTTGLIGISLDVATATEVYLYTLKLIESKKIRPSADQLIEFSSLVSDNNWLDSWSNAMLFERGMTAAWMDSATKPSHLSWWEVHRRFRYSETFYKAILEGWRAIEISADLPPSTPITLVEISKAHHKAEAYVSAPATSLPNPFLDAEWGIIAMQLMGSASFSSGLGHSILRTDAHRALLAAHHINLTSGSFPNTLEEIPNELLPVEIAARLSEAKAALNIEQDKPPSVKFLTPDLTPTTYPP